MESGIKWICRVGMVFLSWISEEGFAQSNNKDSVNESYTGCILPETFPYYRGDSLNAFIKHQLLYPKQALLNGVSGKVYVQFIVEENGELSNVKVLRGIGYGCDEEAMRLVRLTNGNWTVGCIHGKAVKTTFNLPIKFELN